MELEEFFKYLREECLPAVWSRGVELSRTGQILQEAGESDDITLRVTVPGRPVAQQVTLWPDDNAWACDCNEQADPCSHVVAGLLALRGGVPIAQAAPRRRAGRVLYRFYSEGNRLCLRRSLELATGEEPLRSSLITYLGGVRSGRISAAPLAATETDIRIDSFLGDQRSGELSKELAMDILAVLDGKQGAFFDDAPVAVDSRPLRLKAVLSAAEGGVRVHGRAEQPIERMFSQGVVLADGVLRPLQSHALPSELRGLLSPEGRAFAPDEFGFLYGELLPALRQKIEVEDATGRPYVPVKAAARVEIETDVAAGGDALLATPIIVYLHEGKEIGRIRGGRLELRSQFVPERDPSLEQELQRGLRAELSIPPDRTTQFSRSDAVRFLDRASGWRVVGRGVSHFGSMPVLEPDISWTDGQFTLRFSSGAQAADAGAVLDAWRQGENLIPLLDGGLGRLPIGWLSQYGDRAEELLRAAEHKSPKLRQAEAVAFAEELGAPLTEQLQEFADALLHRNALPEPALSAELRAVLRPYQLEGVRWLTFMQEQQLGAMLADDMGLGKTVQALAVLKGRSLVIAPTSVLHAWREQIAQFRPELSVSLYAGTGRRLDPGAAVTLCSYAVLRLDQEELCASHWDTIVLDETQYIKNPDSQVARAAHSLSGTFRIALTGTPVENRPRDLWSQFRYLNPGLLGRLSEFEARYSPQQQNGESNTYEPLRRKIKPFILRRVKREVAPELPPRTELVLRCTLSGEERELYNALLITTRREIRERLGRGEGMLRTLELLLRLRQACCHPALVPGAASELQSAKFELLLEQLEEAVSEGHKLLVFSQWTALLDLLERELNERGFSFGRLDGSTRDRSGVISAFQEQEKFPILLVSLKAGGTGLTLTAADQVYLLDPWWNPAVEDQAADRAHRIGQTNPVFIYRLVAEDTIEERILKLQEQKRELFTSLLSGEGGGALSLTEDDILALLEEGA